MRCRKWWMIAAAVLLMHSTAWCAENKEAGAPKVEGNQSVSRFMRLQRDETGKPTSLQTSVLRYRSAPGKPPLEVYLIGAVHVGDKDYYQRLNDQFAFLDVVLYELVAPTGTVPEPNQKSESIVSAIQDLTKIVLDLELQLDHIDYKRKNFVHADMSPEEMAEVIRKRGGTGLTFAAEVISELYGTVEVPERVEISSAPKAGAALAGKPAYVERVDLATTAFDSNGSSVFKRLAAMEIERTDQNGMLMGKALTWLLIDQRNGKAIEVLKQQIAAGHKRIGIFYGAAHMPDFEVRLKRDFELVPDTELWLTAWDLADKKGGKSPFNRLFQGSTAEHLWNEARDGGREVIDELRKKLGI